MKGCAIDGCDRAHHARGWCHRHYRRWYTHGDPLTLITRPHVVAHGTHNEYNNYGCRCQLCRRAGTAYTRKIQSAPCANCGIPVQGRYRPGALCQACWADTRRTPWAEAHGTSSGYNRGCRCDRCAAYSREARQAHRLARRLPCVVCGQPSTNPLDNRNSPGIPRCRNCWQKHNQLVHAQT